MAKLFGEIKQTSSDSSRDRGVDVTLSGTLKSGEVKESAKGNNYAILWVQIPGCKDPYKVVMLSLDERLAGLEEGAEISLVAELHSATNPVVASMARKGETVSPTLKLIFKHWLGA